MHIINMGSCAGKPVYFEFKNREQNWAAEKNIILFDVIIGSLSYAYCMFIVLNSSFQENGYLTIVSTRQGDWAVKQCYHRNMLHFGSQMSSSRNGLRIAFDPFPRILLESWWFQPSPMFRVKKSEKNLSNHSHLHVVSSCVSKDTQGSTIVMATKPWIAETISDRFLYKTHGDFLWLFQLDDSKSIHKKWLEITISIH